MARLEYDEIRDLTPAEREALLEELERELLNLKAIQAAGGTPENPRRIQELKKIIARVKLIQREENEPKKGSSKSSETKNIESTEPPEKEDNNSFENECRDMPSKVPQDNIKFYLLDRYRLSPSKTTATEIRFLLSNIDEYEPDHLAIIKYIILNFLNADKNIQESDWGKKSQMTWQELHDLVESFFDELQYYFIRQSDEFSDIQELQSQHLRTMLVTQLDKMPKIGD